MKKDNSSFNSRDFFSVFAIAVIIGFVLFFGAKNEISGEYAVVNDKLYGASAIDAGFVVPAPKVYGGAIYRLHPSQFASGKAYVLSGDKPARTYSDNPSYETICPEGYESVRIEDAAMFEGQGYEIVLPGGNIGMNRFACKAKVRG